jgi:hypothetical protein
VILAGETADQRRGIVRRYAGLNQRGIGPKEVSPKPFIKLFARQLANALPTP